ncbi:hypothetical protein DSECCO2_453020 [anaerobic digester metagenome]
MPGCFEITAMSEEDLFFEIPGEQPPAPPIPEEKTPPPTAPATVTHPTPRPPPPSTPPTAHPRRRNWRLTLALTGIGLVLLIAILAVLTFSVVIAPSSGATSYPYTVTYDVVFPHGEQVQIGNISIVAIPYPDRVSLSVDKVPYEIRLNETRQITAKHGTVTLLGVALLSFDFTLDAEYRGMTGSDATFRLAVRTSDQIPKFMIDRLLPADVQARPA